MPATSTTYGLHPALLDIATGYAMDLIPGYGDQDVPQNLWVPISYRALRFYRASAGGSRQLGAHQQTQLASRAALQPSTC